MHIDLEQLDRELGLDEDPLDDLSEDELRAELLDELAGRLGLDDSRLEELEKFVGISGLVIVCQDEIPSRATVVRKCLDCPEPGQAA